ncbi:hypothetical protein ACSBR2_015485 [Camellia fascicularis]
MDDELSEGKGTSEALNSVDESVSETVIVIRSEEQRAENGNPNENSNDSKQDKDYCAIDVKCGSDDRNGKFEENMGGERVCRICHLSSDPSSSPSSSKTPTRTKATRTRTRTTATDTTMIATSSSAAAAARDGLNLIELGCGCKDELGIAHGDCAKAWFEFKGNRQCEICGETANNVTGTVDDRFMEKWSELRPTDDNGVTNSVDRIGQRGRRCCNFLIICTLCGVLLLWSFHYKEKLQ